MDGQTDRQTDRQRITSRIIVVFIDTLAIVRNIKDLTNQVLRVLQESGLAFRVRGRVES
jgi:hypothetical protein